MSSGGDTADSASYYRDIERAEIIKVEIRKVEKEMKLWKSIIAGTLTAVGFFACILLGNVIAGIVIPGGVLEPLVGLLLGGSAFIVAMVIAGEGITKWVKFDD